MKTGKKIYLGLFISLGLALLGIAMPRHSLAMASQAEAKQCVNNLKFVDIAHISCTVNGQTTVFVDNNPTDSEVYYQTNGFEDESSSGAVCLNGEDLNNDKNKYHASDAGSPVTVQNVTLFYPKANGQAGCDEYDANNVTIKDTAGLKNELQGGDNTISSYTDISGGSSLEGHSYSRYPVSGAYDNPPTGSALFGDNVDLDNCSGSILAVYYSGTSGSSATEYDIGKSGDSLSSKKNLANLPTNTCGVSKVNFGITQDANIAIGIGPAVTGIVASQLGKACQLSDTAPDGYTCQCTTDVHTPTGTDCTLVASTDQQTSTSTSDTADSCTDDKSFAWLVCPVLTGLSKGADAINNIVEDQLNFKTSENLTDSVERAWTVFRTVTSIILVIVMLVMVISQAIGGGPFDAYTVRKLLPKLVTAVILMQISWFLCIYAIRLSNDAGQSIGQLMAAPFSGPKALELGPLLQHWSNGGGAIVGAAGLGTVGLIGALVTSKILITWGWPILTLAILLLFFAVLAALATLLVRNALIVLLVITSPLAFLAFVLPGTDRYWKMWKDNFTRVLVFFPLVIAFIYAGRIFAWIAGGLGTAGPLDLIMILAGFFGPYFFLPKTFKWAGPGVAAAANAINNSWPLKKGREVAGRELLAAQKRKQNELVDKYYQSLTRAPDGKKLTNTMRARAGLKRGIIRTAGGHPIPTKRATRVMMQEAGKWKQDEIDLLLGKYNNDYKEFQKGDEKRGIKPMSVQKAKEANRDKNYDETEKNALGNRAFFTWAHDTKSFMEMGDKSWRTGDGRYKDMFKTQGWIDFMHGNPQAYSDFSARLGASSVPYRLPLGGGPVATDYSAPSAANPKGGKRYQVLDQKEVLDKETGKMVKNVYYNPGLKKIIDMGGDRATEIADLEADSERFHKLIAQADDPMSVVSQRPEEFKALRNLTARIKQIGAEADVNNVESVGAVSLRDFIDGEAKSYSGRNTLHRLAAASGPYVDEILDDPGHIERAISPRGGEPEEAEMMEGGGRTVPREGTQEGSGQATTPRTTDTQQAAATSALPGSGYASTGSGTRPGNVIIDGPGGRVPAAQAQPVELKIDHEELANLLGVHMSKAIDRGFKHLGEQQNPSAPNRPPVQNDDKNDDEDNTGGGNNT